MSINKKLIKSKVIDFVLKDKELIVGIGNEILSVENQLILMSFEHEINNGRLISINSDLYAGDLYGNHQAILNNVLHQNYTHQYKLIFSDNSLLVNRKEPKECAKIDSQGNLLWKHEFILPGSTLHNNKYIILKDYRDKDNRKLLVTDIQSGNIYKEFNTESEVLRTIAIDNQKCILINNSDTQLLYINFEEGTLNHLVDIDRIRKPWKESGNISLGNLGGNFSKLILESNFLIHPLFMLNFKTNQISENEIMTRYFCNANGIISFILDYAVFKNYLVTALHIDKEDRKATGKLIFQDLDSSQIVYELNINDNKYAGIRKIISKENELFVLDSNCDLWRINTESREITHDTTA